MCVWKPDGTPTAQPLKDFVAATEAEAKKKRFKVPAYRHPDPLRHPVFTDFGNSRWAIDFSAHRARQRVLKCSGALAKAERELSSATEAQRQAEQKKVENCRKKLRQAEEDLERNDDHRLELKVWNGQAVESRSFRWSSKRLVDDLAIRSAKDSLSNFRTCVSRADRLGRVAGGAAGSGSATLTSLFEQDLWNGRLQAPRAQLDAIARHVDKHGWNAKARELIDRIRWLVTFSAQLECRGPWHNYFHEQADKSPFRKVIASGPRKGQIYESANGWPHAISNDARAGRARLALSRLPGLRVLSVDLGHRYAAACAVWEALAPETMKTEIHGYTIIAGDCGPDDLYCHTRQTDSHGKERTTVYRRIGPDALPDGTAHPAPWARLDRQFLIKLQGEDRPARKASPHEIEAVEQFEEWAGRKRSDDDPPRELAVDALMSDTVRTARLALARHARRAKIAYQLTATARTLPGARFQELDEAGRLELLLDTLADWHALATDSRWTDESARQSWNNRLAALAGGLTIEPPQLLAQTQQESAKAQRREAEQALRGKLQPLAQSLSGNETLRRQLHQDWCARWSADDDQWKQKLKWLSRWLMPRQLSRMIDVTKQDGRRVKRREPIREAVAAASNVGGLSLTRISTLTEFRRKVQVGYFTRMWPDGSRAEIGLGFGQSTLDTLERMKDQRIKQLASRIVEAALGIGIEKDPVWDDAKKKWREHKRPKQRETDPRFAPCHAVIIEDLSHYRPEETRTRRENRATMDWKSAETRKRLEDHCQLYGLHLRNVNPQYTSRQDSRTGAGGIRCVDVPVVDFLSKPWWHKQVARAQSKTGQNNKGDARDRYLLALHTKWSGASEEEKAGAAPLRIPLDSGEIFVSADLGSPLAAGIQADLNAAANIGLCALMDPDFPGRWWYVPCDPATHQPKADKVKGCILENVGPLAEVKQADQTAPPRRKGKRSAKTTKEKEVVNLWRDPAPDLLSPKSWCEYPEYLSKVRFRVVQILRARAGLPREDGK